MSTASHSHNLAAAAAAAQTAGEQNRVLANVVSMEMTELIEHWRFVGDEIHILLAKPVTSCCGVPHSWLINCDGRTRCVDCHHWYLVQREQLGRSRR